MTPAAGRVVAIGEEAVLEGLGLAGVAVLSAETPEEARSAWELLGPDTAVVVLSPAAAAALTDAPHPSRRLRVVVPGQAGE